MLDVENQVPWKLTNSIPLFTTCFRFGLEISKPEGRKQHDFLLPSSHSIFIYLFLFILYDINSLTLLSVLSLSVSISFYSLCLSPSLLILDTGLLNLSCYINQGVLIVFLSKLTKFQKVYSYKPQGVQKHGMNPIFKFG